MIIVFSFNTKFILKNNKQKFKIIPNNKEKNVYNILFS